MKKRSLLTISPEKLHTLLLELGSQQKVGAHLGVSQMTISRFCRDAAIKFDGREQANVKKGRTHSETMLAKFASGYVSPLKGRPRDPEIVARVAEKAKGRVPWNFGISPRKECVTCEVCLAVFSALIGRKRRFCSKTCAGKYMSNLYSDGRFLGEKNPNFGNSKVKLAWVAGRYDARKLNNHGRGKGGFHGEIWMRSSWELAYAQMLDEQGVAWEFEPRKFHLRDGRSYTPDFYLPADDAWIEIKGWWTPTAKEKFALFKQQYPEIRITVISDQIWKQN